jgi:hypothetical protein
MGLLSTENELRVEVIGSDGVRRTGYVPRTDTVAFNKYLITSKDIFLVKMKKFDLLPFVQPTICFREDSIHAIPRESDSSFPTPAETGDAIAGAAWALAKLLISKEEKWKLLVMILCACAMLAGGFSAYMSYDTQKKVNAIGLLLTTDNPGAGSTPVPTVIQPRPTITVGGTPTVKPVNTVPTMPGVPK